MTDDNRIGHRHKDAKGAWGQMYYEDPDTSVYGQRIAALEARVAVLEGEEPAPEPSPEPPPGNVRGFPAGTYGDLTAGTDHETWVFETGAIVKGRVILAAKNLTIRGLVATAEQCHETPVVLAKGSSGVIDGFNIQHIGTPSNGKGYSTMSADDDDRGVGTFGPWTIRNGEADQRGFSWCGLELWGVRDLVIEDVLLRISGNGPGEHMGASIPRSDGAIMRRVRFDMTGSMFYGVELADVSNAVIEDCEAWGTGPAGSQFRAMLQLNNGSGAVEGTQAHRNRVRDLPTFVNAHGYRHNITDNCLNNVARGFSGAWSDPASVTWARNGPC